jgi:hypothetical protein
MDSGRPIAGSVLVAAIALACACGGSGGTPGPSLPSFVPADVVIGQPDFASRQPNQGGAPGPNTLHGPNGIGDGSLYVPDGTNHRVLGFLSPPLANDASADFVLGQPDFASNAPGTSAMEFSFPFYARVFGGKLFLTDGQNHRVLVWNTPPVSDTPADVVVGQSDFLTGSPATAQGRLNQPQGLFVAAGRLFVADNLNNRVLVWNAVPAAPGAPADLVLGQATFTDALPNRGGSPAADTLNRPAAVWSDGVRLFVLDAGNHRVLAWNALPTTNGEAADRVMGQADFATATEGVGPEKFSFPTDIDSNGTQFFLADAGNNRVLVWNAVPLLSSAPADRVLGQGDFVHAAPNDDDQDGVEDLLPTARTLNSGASWLFVRAAAGRLFVGDWWNHRVLVFDGF